MSISLLSLKSEESKAIVDSIYKCYLKGSDLYVSDGVNEWIINQAELTDLEERLQAILETKASISHEHSISDVTNLQTALDNKANTSHEHSISDVTNLTTTLQSKANASHLHEFADIYKTITITNQDETTTTIIKSLDQILQEIEAGTSPIAHTHDISDVNNLQTILNNKANTSHQHEFADIYKTIVNQDQTTTNKSLETILNEREADIRAFIRTKADASHSHTALEIAYNDDRSVKAEIDRINSRISKTTTAGAVVDIFDVIFGTDADAGLQYEVSQLQAVVAALQTEIACNELLGTGEELFEGFDSLGDVSQGTNVLQRLANTIRSLFSRITASLQGYAQVATPIVDPLYGAIML